MNIIQTLRNKSAQAVAVGTTAIIPVFAFAADVDDVTDAITLAGLDMKTVAYAVLIGVVLVFAAYKWMKKAV